MSILKYNPVQVLVCSAGGFPHVGGVLSLPGCPLWGSAAIRLVTILQHTSALQKEFHIPLLVTWESSEPCRTWVLGERQAPWHVLGSWHILGYVLGSWGRGTSWDHGTCQTHGTSQGHWDLLGTWHVLGSWHIPGSSSKHPAMGTGVVKMPFPCIGAQHCSQPPSPPSAMLPGCLECHLPSLPGVNETELTLGFTAEIIPRRQLPGADTEMANGCFNAVSADLHAASSATTSFRLGSTGT